MVDPTFLSQYLAPGRSRLDQQIELGTAAGHLLLQASGHDLTDPGVAETPERVGKAWAELTSGYGVDVSGLFKSFDAPPASDTGMVIVKDIQFYSLCQHHLLPFFGKAAIGYIPTDRVLGLSKFARVTEAYARRLQIQEGLTNEIASAIDTHLSPRGVMVVITAEHTCMSLRGVRSPCSTTVTSAIRGVFTEAVVRQEFLALMKQG